MTTHHESSHMDWTRREVWTRKLLYPGHTFPTAAGPVIVAVGLAIHDRVFAVLPALGAFIAGWLIQFGGVVADNYENLVAQPDDKEHPELVKAIKSGVITLPGLRATFIACYAIAALIGLALVYVGGLAVLIIGVLSVVASWAYSSGRWPLGRAGLGDPLFFLFFGIVSVIGTYYVQAASVAPGSWRSGFTVPGFMLGIPVGALITAILVIDDIRDRDFDIIKGKRTIAVRFGVKWSRIEFALLEALGYTMPFLFWLVIGMNPVILLPLITLPAALRLIRDLWQRQTFRDLLPMTPRAALLSLSYSVLLAIGLVLSSA